jgi:hypothetical protein
MEDMSLNLSAVRLAFARRQRWSSMPRQARMQSELRSYLMHHLVRDKHSIADMGFRATAPGIVWACPVSVEQALQLLPSHQSLLSAMIVLGYRSFMQHLYCLLSSS